MADENYWEYKASTPTPSLLDAKWIGAIRTDTTEEDWHKLSPGMRREIVRARTKNLKLTLDGYQLYIYGMCINWRKEND